MVNNWDIVTLGELFKMFILYVFIKTQWRKTVVGVEEM